MNKWQMDSNTMTWDARGGHGRDSKNATQYSIHPLGRTDASRDKQRKRRAQTSASRHMARVEAQIGTPAKRR